MTTYLAVIVVTVGCLVVTVEARAALQDPVHWGTFRPTHVTCAATRYGESCTPVGDWSAQDGGVTLRDVRLDDSGVDRDDVPTVPVRAGWRDVDAEDDGFPTVVYDRESIDLGWVGPLIAAALTPALGVYVAGRWGDLGRLWRAWQRRRPRRAPAA